MIYCIISLQSNIILNINIASYSKKNDENPLNKNCLDFAHTIKKTLNTGSAWLYFKTPLNYQTIQWGFELLKSDTFILEILSTMMQTPVRNK